MAMNQPQPSIPQTMPQMPPQNVAGPNGMGAAPGQTPPDDEVNLDPMDEAALSRLRILDKINETVGRQDLDVPVIAEAVGKLASAYAQLVQQMNPQQEFQLKVAEMQMKQQEMQAKLQFEAEKHRMDMEHQQQQGALDVQMKQQQMQTSAMEQQQKLQFNRQTNEQKLSMQKQQAQMKPQQGDSQEG